MEVAYARPERQFVASVLVPAGATAREAIDASGVCKAFPEINLADQAVGIFGRLVSLDHPVRAGDRVEIYRPLATDPPGAAAAAVCAVARRGRSAVGLLGVLLSVGFVITAAEQSVFHPAKEAFFSLRVLIPGVFAGSEVGSVALSGPRSKLAGGRRVWRGVVWL